MPVPRREVPVVQRHPVAGLLPLLRLRGGRRRHQVPDGDRRARRSPRRSSGWPTSTASSCATRRAADRAREARRATSARGCSRRTRPPQAFYADAARRPPDAPAGAAVPHRARLRPGRRRDVRRRVRAARRRGAATSTCGRRASPTRSSSSAGSSAQGQRGHYDRFRGRLLWPIRETTGDDDRLRRPADLRRRPDRGEVPQHLRDADLQEEPRALRHRPGPPRHRPRLAGGRRRGLHRRDGLPPGRRADRGRHLRHRVRRGPRPRAAPAAAGPRRVPRRGDLHLRRRRGRPEGRAAGVRGRPEVRRPDLRRRRARGMDPCDLRLAEGDAAVRELVARRIPLYRFVLGNVVSAATTSTAPTGASTRCARPPSWSRRSATGPRSRRSPASSPAWSASTSSEARAEVRRRREPAGPDEPPPQAGPPQRGRRAGTPSGPRRRRCPTCATRGSPSSARRSSSSSSTRRPSAGWPSDVDGDDFTHPTYRAVWEAVTACGGPAERARREVWVAQAARQPSTDAAGRAGAVRPGGRAAAVQQGRRPRRTSRRTSTGSRRSPPCAGSPT